MRTPDRRLAHTSPWMPLALVAAVALALPILPATADDAELARQLLDEYDDVDVPDSTFTLQSLKQ